MPSFYVGAVLLTDDSARMPRGGAILTRHGLPWRLAEAMKPEIDVVIVSYNNRETLRECVEPLVARPGVTVTVVDNAASDNSLAAVADLPVRRLNSGRNGGFAFACNIGMAFGRAPLVLFINPGARIELGDLERLASVLATEPGVGIVGPRLLDSTAQLSPSLCRYQRASSIWAQAVFLHRLLPRARWANEIVRDAAGHKREAFAEWLPGACLLGRRDLLERLGGFDEGCVRFARLHAGPASAFAQRLGLIIGALTHVLVNAGRRDHALGHATALWTTLARYAR